MRTLVLPAFLAVAVAVPAAAQERAERRAVRQEARAERQVERGTKDAHVDGREVRQAHRVARGIRRGSLTPGEATALAGQESAFAAEESAFKSDGVLTKGERQTLRGQLDTMSRSIFDEKHDLDGVAVVYHPRFGDASTRIEAHEAAFKAERLAHIRARLNLEISDEERAKLQLEHDALVDDLFVLE